MMSLGFKFQLIGLLVSEVVAGVMEGMLKPSEECPISNTRAVPRQVF